MRRLALALVLATPLLVAVACTPRPAASAHNPGTKVDLQSGDSEYKHGDVTCQGFVAVDGASSAKRPGVLIVHQWKGLTEYEKNRAKMLARMGYVAFCADVYGKGIRPKTREEAGAEAGKYRGGDRQLLRDRVAAALAELKTHALCDPNRVAAIGYCFGGGAVLELARSGADLRGVASFHGNVDTPRPANAATLKAKILVLHGADDTFVNEKVPGFYDEMRAAKADWQFIHYGNAVHSFTEVAAGNDPSQGSAYDEKADKRSWALMKAFFDEIFATP